MKFTSLILDFDGVLGDTYKVYVDFLTKKLKFSGRRAEMRMQKSATEITPRSDNFVGKMLQRWYYWNFFRFLKTYPNLLFTERANEIRSINAPKAILTRSYAHICEYVLGEHFADFVVVVGKETASNKVKGMEFILSKEGFEKDRCLFVTDTVADVVEVNRVLPKEQIYAVDWGFNQTDFLEKHLPPGQIFHNDFLQLFELIEPKTGQEENFKG